MFRVSTVPIIKSTKNSPELATMEGSSFTDIMTSTGGCGYSF